MGWNAVQLYNVVMCAHRHRWKGSFYQIFFSLELTKMSKLTEKKSYLQALNFHADLGGNWSQVQKWNNWFSLQQNRFSLRSQAFTSAPDMASSGVWENVLLTITPTFDGVCRMLWFIILDGFFVKIWHICHFAEFLLAKLLRLFFVTDVIITFC